jgi:hypothetical protein
MRRFYTTTTTENAAEFNLRLRRALLFCQCGEGVENGDSDDGYGACRAVRGTFQRPACTAVELPPPDCRDVIDRCDNDVECRSLDEHINHVISVTYLWISLTLLRSFWQVPEYDIRILYCISSVYAINVVLNFIGFQI